MEVLAARSVQATAEDTDGRGGLSIAIMQPSANTGRWQLSVRAHTDEQIVEVGACVVCPPSAKLSRVVAIASCPGARKWTVLATLLSGAQGGEISLAVGLPQGPAGLVRVGERYKYYSGAAPGAVALPDGETVIGWSAFSTGAGATVVIDGGSAITIPTSGAIAGGPGGLLDGPTFTFAGLIGGYFIEVAESA